MKARTSMTTNQFLGSACKALAVLPVAVALLSGTALAATATTAAKVDATKVTTTKTVTKSYVDVLVSGTVAGPTEAIYFDKQKAQVTSVLTSPGYVALQVTFLKAVGYGVDTKTKYITESVVPYNALTGTATVPVEFSIALEKKPYSPVGTGNASFSVTTDTNGVITGATGAIVAAPSF